jgi:hypothetical protein
LGGAEPTDWTTIADVTRARIKGAGTQHKAADPLFAGAVGFRNFRLDTSNIRALIPDAATLEQSLFSHQNHLVVDRSDSDVLYELLLKRGLDLCVPIETKFIDSQMTQPNPEKWNSELDIHLRKSASSAGNMYYVTKIVEPQITQMNADKTKTESGIHLHESAESTDKKNIAVKSIGGGVLIPCRAIHIDAEDVEVLVQSIAAWHKQLAPAGDTTWVFRDSAFADDVTKTNMAAILAQNGIANVRSL